MKHFYLKYSLFILSFLLLGLTGCSTSGSDDLTKASEDNTSSVENAKLILTLNTPASRAVDATIDGTDPESKINTASVFFVNSSSNLITNVVNFTNLTSAGNLTVNLDAQSINVGVYHVYVITNLAVATANGFVGKNILSLNGTISSINDVIGSSSSSFVMSGQALQNTDSSPNLIFSTKGVTYFASVDLYRAVAKVLLTATVGTDGYVPDPKGASFIEVGNIQFSLQTTNKSFYYLKNVVSGVVEDLNYDMDSYLNSTSDFMNPEASKIAQIYDETKINNNDASYTSNSLYCLENTTDQSTSFATWTSPVQLANAQKVATYVKVTLNGATPRIIDGTTYATATAAKAVLTGGKFYTYLKGSTDAERILCFSSKDLVAAHFGVSVDDAFIQEHSVSDTYNFYTFVNGKTFSASSSSVLRNNYYILDITEISTPYLSKIMEINTKVTGWSLKGTTTQNVDTSGTTE